MTVRGIQRVLADPEVLGRYSEHRARSVCQRALDILRDEPSLIRIGGGSTLFVGDTHGDYGATVKAGEHLLGSKTRYLVFLGDYVDRGENPIKNLLLVLLLKLRRPRRTFVLRGNHEVPSVCERFGFRELVEQRYSPEMYCLFKELFSHMPLAAVTRGGIFAVHGGISKNFDRLSKIEKIPKGQMEESPEGWGGLLWNDPEESVDDFAPNVDREMYRFFGADAFSEFMDREGLRLMVRSHQCFPKGYRYFFDGRLLSIFSRKDYNDGNKGVLALVDGKGGIEFVDL